jgi:hypothetical protein
MISFDQESRVALACARKALEAQDRFWLGNVPKLEVEFYELGLLTEEERYLAVDIALIEIVSGDRKGPVAPHDRAGHGPFFGEKLYAFKWESQNLKKLMYLKFALPSKPPPEKLAVYSLHETE